MRFVLPFAFLLSLTTSAVSQQAPSAQEPASSVPSAAPTTLDADLKTPAVSPEQKLRHLFEEKIEAEWAAIKSQDKKAYGNFLADDYEGIEVDGKGERSRIQAMNELSDSNIASYTLWGFKLIPLDENAAFAIYEVTMLFPPKAQVRYSRLYIGELWVKQSGEWKIVHSQETHVK